MRHEIREIMKIISTELDGYLSQFVLAARTKAEKDYEPSSLRGIAAKVERHLRQNYLQRHWFHKNKKRVESETKASQATWTRKQTKSHNGSCGRWNWDSIDKKLFGLSSPQAPLNTVWLNNMIHFGLRGCKEQKELRWGNIVLKTDSDGKEYLETLNAKWRLERERIYGIKGRSGRECMSTRMPFLSIVIRCTFTRCTK